MRLIVSRSWLALAVRVRFSCRMLYTRKGDDGTTILYRLKKTGKTERVKKTAAVVEALGCLDEVNSFLGLCKARLADGELSEIVHSLQQRLFIVQAEVAGSDKAITSDNVAELEAVADRFEQELPPIKSFAIAGETEASALFDVARAQARRAERRVTEAVEKGEATISEPTRSYLNRLSSVLYALARVANHRAGVKEHPPDY